MKDVVPGDVLKVAHGFAEVKYIAEIAVMQYFISVTD